MAARRAEISAGSGWRPASASPRGPGAQGVAHEAEQGLVDEAEAPGAARIVEPIARLGAECGIEPVEAFCPVAVTVAHAARLGGGSVFLRNLGATQGGAALVALDARPLPGDLARARLLPAGRLLLGPLGNPAVDPLPEARIDPVVAGVQHVVDPLAQRLVVAAVAVHGGHAAGLVLLLQPVAGAEAVVAAELDVGAAAGHVGGDGDGAGNAGLGDDVRLLLVVARVQHLVRDRVAAVLAGQLVEKGAHVEQMALELVLLAVLELVRLLPDVGAQLADVLAVLQQRRELLGLLDGDGANQDRLAAAPAVGDLGNDGARFLLGGAVDLVVLVGAVHRHVGGHLQHVELVDVAELVGLGGGRAGHAGELGVEAEVVLEGDGGERLVLRLDADVLLGLQGLVQAVGVAPALHHAAGELVDDDDLVALHDVVAVAQEQGVSLEGLVGVVDDRHVLDVVEGFALEEVLLPEEGLDLLVADLGEGDLALLLVQLVEALGLEQLLELLLGVGLGEIRHDPAVRDHHPLHQLVEGDVELGAVLHGAGDDEGGAGLVDQDRVHLVDDGVDVPALHHLAGAHLHVVAQVVEAQLVVGAVGDIAGVLRAPLIVLEPVHDAADAEPQELVDAAHPLGVALGEVVVDGDDVHAAARERVEVDGKRGNQRLALAGLHLGDLALVQDHAADHLHIEVALAQRAPGRLADGGEGGDEELVEIRRPRPAAGGRSRCEPSARGR